MNTTRNLVSSFATLIVFSVFLLPGGRALGETLQVNGIEMYYEIIGEGEPLILLHGALLHTGDTWKNVADDFAKNFQVIVPDLRGHGATMQPSGEYFTTKQIAFDVFGLLDHLDIDSFSAMGISMGGVTLLHMATQQPDRIDSMVLIGTAGYRSADGREIARSNDPYAIPEDQMRRLREIHKHGDQQIISLMEWSRKAADDYQDINFTPPYLSTIRANTLIVHGERDRRIPISNAMEMYEAIPNSFLWIVPNGSHVPIRQFYEENFIEVAEAFLSGQMIPGRNKNIN
jgi:pimeloyl-ACP methyl ester carboxylesterase